MDAPPLSVIIHGHFYQPPREDPWTGRIERQPSAAPFRDWNARIEAECYRAVVAARVPGPGGRIQQILNTLRHISFNFGPTLLEWMEREAPRSYEAILEADAFSRRALGQGNAMAQAYHHAILPLASRRDKVTEVRWGLEDFRRRFRREAVGMWLPETAVDAETLDVVAREGLAFAVVAPHQVDPVPARGMPGIYRTPSGKTLALFPYDGALSHDVAFGHLLKNSEGWLGRILGEEPNRGTPGNAEGDETRMGAWGGAGGEKTTRNVSEDVGEESPPRGTWEGADEERESRGAPGGAGDGGSVDGPRLVSMATDGETYGHHHPFGEMALAAVLTRLAGRSGVRVENYASFLAHSPPVEEVELVEPSSWSCSHGVDRWRKDCGCKMDSSKHTQQAWRMGLREAMEWLAEKIHAVYEAETREYFPDPWRARNEYGRVVAGLQTPGGFLDRRIPSETPLSTRRHLMELMELERNALRLFTSCGWFFDDLAGIEPLQVLSYAARALEQLGPEHSRTKEGFLALLDTAETNEDPPRDGATLFLEEEETRELIRRWVPPEENENGAAAGDPDLPRQLGLALEEAVRALAPQALSSQGGSSAPAGPGPGAAFPGEATPDPELRTRILAVRELALLHARRRLPIPFDAQTDFYRTLEEASGGYRTALSTLLEPLGFSAE